MKKLIFIVFYSSLCFYNLQAQKFGTFKDERDDHVYKWVEIGEQIWMAENLAFLPIVFSPRTKSISKPIYYVYGFRGTNVSEARIEATYMDVLYNYPAAKKACPNGWHLPSDFEWKVLEQELGMLPEDVDLVGYDRGFDEGSKLKSSSGWMSNGGGTNSSGFNGEPQGYKGIYLNYEYFHGKNQYGKWWTSTERTSKGVWFRGLSSGGNGIIRESSGKDSGYSIRCVKD